MKVVGLDFAAQMLQYARKRAASEFRRQSAEIEWVEGDATNLSFQDQSFDAVTMGYGLRNVWSRLPICFLHKMTVSCLHNSALFAQDIGPANSQIWARLATNDFVHLQDYLC